MRTYRVIRSGRTGALLACEPVLGHEEERDVALARRAAARAREERIMEHARRVETEEPALQRDARGGARDMLAARAKNRALRRAALVLLVAAGGEMPSGELRRQLGLRVRGSSHILEHPWFFLRQRGTGYVVGLTAAGREAAREP